MTILVGTYGDPTFLDPIRVLSVGSHPVPGLVNPANPSPGFVNQVLSRFMSTAIHTRIIQKVASICNI